MNRLAGETSPYLLQHASNPVDWHAWGSEALERAKSENKPILLSIGYAACHWCHVMEHESFEDEATARIMNEHFVNIKVDREERPDLDAIYMSAVQAMTGQGGWPMTVFLTPHGVPFFGGTYFPPEERHGMPSFKRVLQAMSDAYSKRPEEISRATAQMRDLYGRATLAAQGTGALDARILERGYRTIAQRHDMRNGGFEGAPKFPQAMALDYLLRYWRRTGTADALEMAVHSFRKMARGGIYDQVGGGFHRYSVDAVWLVPHFEKMLYDNALLARLGIHLYQATRDAEIRRVTEETVDWVAREMTSPEGGFYSSLDADSEGHEGKFYVWTAAELETLLGADSDLVKAYYGVTPTGNFEGKSILFIPFDPVLVSARTSVSEAMIGDTIERAKRTLYAERAKRVWPARDDKILAGWNGLMLCAVAEVARITGRADHRALAVRNGEFLARTLVRDGRVLRSYKDGVAKLNGYLEDYAAVGLGMLALYELTFERRWLDQARTLADAAIAWFWDESAGSFFDTSSDHETLISRPRELTDNATPSGTALAADLLLRLSELTQDSEKRRRVTSVLEMAAEPMARHGPAFGYLLGVADMAAQGAVEVALVGDPTAEDFRALTRTLAEHYAPALVIAGGMPNDSTGVTLLDDRPMLDGRATAYVCRQYTCEAPVTDIQALGEQVERAVRATTVTPYKTPTRSDPDP